ncbi:TATA box-binding protein-associated factor RNA polymerase I subunit C isoform X2 [Cottoperca gobio]|nr:TATA box-binding protein-associated factor RNA polymerase I subunit C isoform X2 [Cottoperca gobio]XP_029300114.1 TATA box-binding protein-associated factor RNA polymerase I subunit C isoform X2 [Cottoperca gobio]
MQNFFMDHCQDAFGCMSEILSENVNFNEGPRKKYRSDMIHIGKMKTFLDRLKLKTGPQPYLSRSLNMYSALLSDVLPAIPPGLMGSLLYEELTEQRDRMLFSEGATGGALAFVPFSQSSSDTQRGCLLYPRNQGLDCLNFHRVELQHHRGSSSCVDASSSEPFSFQLKGPVRQISSASLLDDCCVAVRSDRLCGVWRFSERNKPHLLQVVNTREVATCISVSPHVLGEVLVASESGAANLWTVGRGMQTVRKEDQNLYFNAKSSWRWCEFSAHPRVMLYADRTGVELTDIRVSPVSNHTMFRISKTPECRTGERLILSRYLGDVHPFQHLINTQYSAYIMDERFPCMPMLKWDHMMQSPPTFCHSFGGSASGSAGGGARTTKILLGSHSSQEITLLQYSGGRAEACSSRGPPQALLRPRDSLRHLPVQIPHRLDLATSRLSSPAAGLTCIQKRGGREAGGEECICILQLTEAGDIFYQFLEPEQPDTSPPPAAEDEPLPAAEDEPLPAAEDEPLPAAEDEPLPAAEDEPLPAAEDEPLPAAEDEPLPAAEDEPLPAAEDEPLPAAEDEPLPPPALIKTAKQLLPHSQMIISDTSSDEDIIGPSQSQTVQRSVAETPEREQQSSDSSSEDSESGGKAGIPKHLQLQVVVNDDPELEQVSGLEAGVEDGKEGKDNADGTEGPSGVEETASCPKLSDSALVTWKHWLQKLMQKSRKKNPRQHCRQHLTVKTTSLVHLSDDEARDWTEKERVEALRRDLRACMSKRSLLVHRADSASLRAPDVIMVPDVVDTEAWSDQLSRRLSLSWQGEEAWCAWWEDQLGMNKEKKLEALKTKRRREKEAKRASGQRLELSASFTSSISYQSEVSDFSDLTGWSSAASQGAWSDTEGKLSQFEGLTGEWDTKSFNTLHHANRHSSSHVDHHTSKCERRTR